MRLDIRGVRKLIGKEVSVRGVCKELRYDFSRLEARVQQIYTDQPRSERLANGALDR